jgi:hypothetical protein
LVQGKAWHAVLSWASYLADAQAWHYRLIFGPGWPEKATTSSVPD